VRAGTAKEPQS